jgi:hypothetical protein
MISPRYWSNFEEEVERFENQICWNLISRFSSAWGGDLDKYMKIGFYVWGEWRILVCDERFDEEGRQNVLQSWSLKQCGSHYWVWMWEWVHFLCKLPRNSRDLREHRKNGQNFSHIFDHFNLKWIDSILLLIIRVDEELLETFIFTFKS